MWSGINLLSYSFCAINTLLCGKISKKKNVLDIVPTLKDNIMSKGRNDGPSNLLLHTNPLQTLVAENNNNFITHHSVGQELKQG